MALESQNLLSNKFLFALHDWQNCTLYPPACHPQLGPDTICLLLLLLLLQNKQPVHAKQNHLRRRVPSHSACVTLFEGVILSREPRHLSIVGVGERLVLSLLL